MEDYKAMNNYIQTMTEEITTYTGAYDNKIILQPITIQVSNVNTDYIIVMPQNQGGNNETLINDGSGNLVWGIITNFDQSLNKNDDVEFKQVNVDEDITSKVLNIDKITIKATPSVSYDFILPDNQGVDGEYLTYDSNWENKNIYDQDLNKNDDVEFGSIKGDLKTSKLTLFKSLDTIKITNGGGTYNLVMPKTQGGDKQTLINDGLGVLSWSNINKYDQDLNKGDVVEFEETSVNKFSCDDIIIDKITLSGFNTKSYSIKLPDNQGGLNETLINDGSGNLFWGSINPFNQLLNKNNKVVFNEMTSNLLTTSNLKLGSIFIKSPNLSSDYTLILPEKIGLNNYALKTDGTDTTEWADSGGQTIDQVLNKGDNATFGSISCDNITLSNNNLILYDTDGTNKVNITQASITTEDYDLIMPSKGGDNNTSLVYGLSWSIPLGLITIFGDGSDGDLTKSSGSVVLSKDMYYNNVSLSGGAVIHNGDASNSFRIFIKGTLTFDDGFIASNGTNGSAGGTAKTSGTIGGSGNGGSGNTGDGNDGGSITNACGGKGGKGGNSIGDGGNGGNVSGVSLINGGNNNVSGSKRVLGTLNRAVLCRNLSLGKICGGSGGGAGGGAGLSGVGGRGGSGASVCFVSARKIINSGGNGVFEAKGGNGASGTGSGAGGGGGGGGLVFIITTTDTLPSGITIDVSGGTKAGSGSNGGIGDSLILNIN